MEAEKEKREQSNARKGGGRNTGKRIERDLNRY